MVVAQVDADKHKKLAKRFNIEGFPTLKWVPKGSTFDKAVDVQAERTAQGLLRFINDETGLSKKLKGEESSIIEVTADNFDELSKKEGAHSLIEFYAPWCGHVRFPCVLIPLLVACLCCFFRYCHAPTFAHLPTLAPRT